MKTVLTCGTFDLFHRGHLHLLEKAKEYGDRLVVVVSRDKRVEQIKGKLPFYNEEERKQMLEALKIVDEVRLGSVDDPYEVLSEIKPDVVALGYDQVIYVDKLAQKITEYGLHTQIVRLCPYNEDYCKSSKLKEVLGLTDCIIDNASRRTAQL